jgi:spore maturation protein CgeB
MGQNDLADRLTQFAVSGRVEVKPAKNGLLTMLVDGKPVHSKYDPERESEGISRRLFESRNSGDSAVLFGLGLGYLAERFVEAFSEKDRIIYEPNPEIAVMALSSRTLNHVLSQSRLIVDDPETWRMLSVSKSPQRSVYVTPSYLSLHRRTQAEIESSSDLKQDTENQSYRILLVGPLYGGSLPVTRYVNRALNNLGHDVFWLDHSSLQPSATFFSEVSTDPDRKQQIESQFIHLLTDGVYAKVLEWKPQIVLFMAQSPGTPDLLQRIRNEGVPTALWFVEDGDRFAYGEKMAPFYDVFFHIQGEAFSERLRMAGARNVHYLPMAADPEEHKLLELSDDERKRFGSDVSHVGAGYPNRRASFQRLLGYDFKLWGSEWENPGPLGSVLQEQGRRLETDEVVKVFNASRINVNLHSSMKPEGVPVNGDFVNPRTFELASAGAFQLVDSRSLLGDLFDEGSEVVVFASIDELCQKIDYYLQHPEEAETIADASRSRVLKDHTYEHRMNDAIQFIEQSCTIPARSSDSPATIGELIQQSQSDPELVDFLKSLGNLDDLIDLKKIGNRVRHGTGAMSRPEAIFLLMDEFNRWAEEKGVA